MVRKLKELETTEDETLVKAVCSSAHEIWQAGLGAFSRAQKEGGDIFSRLVEEGTELQKRTQHLVGYKDLGVTDTVTKMAENVSRQATGSWEKLEKVFEDRVSRSLRGLGVPTQDDVKGLSRQIDDLAKSIAALSGMNAAGGKMAGEKRRTKPERPLSVKSALKRSAVKGAVKPAARKAARQATTPH
jgi:poly(hydroxyalkanoate) granule-associated protein